MRLKEYLGGVWGYFFSPIMGNVRLEVLKHSHHGNPAQDGTQSDVATVRRGGMAGP